jgi:NADPH:quinone reductase-like Zn-dependent oxidoreductase
MKLKRRLKWTGAALLFLLVGLHQISYWSSTNDCSLPIPAGGERMQAFRACEYGGADALQLVNLPRPTPADDQVLVRVRAASLNPVDGHMIRGGVVAGLFGRRKPKESGFGRDYSGVIEAVGKNVTQFKPGDEVFGARQGALAEYVCARADRAIVLKPANLTFEQASGAAVAGLTALQGLRDNGKLRAGQKVLINGASGGVGTFAVQIAKAFGAEVTGVCSTRNLELVRSLGADHVIDYTKEDYTKRGDRYDLIFDLVGNHSFSARRGALNPNGICVLGGVGGAGLNEGQILPRIAGTFWSLAASKFGHDTFVTYIAQVTKADLEFLRGLMEEGKVTPVVDRNYAFREAPAALRYLEQGRARGKVVVTVGAMVSANTPSATFASRRLLAGE